MRDGVAHLDSYFLSKATVKNGGNCAMLAFEIDIRAQRTPCFEMNDVFILL